MKSNTLKATVTVKQFDADATHEEAVAEVMALLGDEFGIGNVVIASDSYESEGEDEPKAA